MSSSGGMRGSTTVVAITLCAILGSALATRWWWWLYPHPKNKNNDDDDDEYDWERLARAQRRRLPDTIILVRHGESEANADCSVWQTIPDNLLGLTVDGQEQATAVGHRIASILESRQCRRVHLVVSPFERTLQTAVRLRPAFEQTIVRTDIESRIREQVRCLCV